MGPSEAKILSTYIACVCISSNGVQSLCDVEAQAPLDLSVNLSDCCKLNKEALPHIKTLVQRGTQQIILSETKDLTSQEYATFYADEIEPFDCRENWNKTVRYHAIGDQTKYVSNNN